MATLILSDGTTFQGEPFGYLGDTDGEVVFTTGMVGYPETLTDPSFRGQVVVFTYPLIGNYGVPEESLNRWGFSEHLESEEVQVRAVVTAQASETFSHFAAAKSLDQWLKEQKIPGITGIDTRALTKKLREHGVMLGRIVQDDADAVWKDVRDPNERNLVAEVSCKEVTVYEPAALAKDAPTIIAYDCGMKRNIIRSFLKRGVRFVRVPWDFDLDSYNGQVDAVFVSNGPGDPKKCDATIKAMRRALERDIPTFGICLGNQLMALAIGGDTYKLKYGHRGVNQPCVEEVVSGQWSVVSNGKKIPSELTTDHSKLNTHHCIITSQNHGFAVSEELPKGWHVWFRNANDETVEGIRHDSGKFFAVQFHPEATPGPEDAGYLFDEFVEGLRKGKK
jgi:carbamoyl-phosphate synthase small subunit